ncbi:MAG TPA: hypothetical protein VHX19_20680 [Stellaceae bacterium]|nr:hypothetical protein [Stellaceae bacterium]
MDRVFRAADKGISAKHGLEVTMRFVPRGLDLRIVAGGTSEQGKYKEMGRVMAISVERKRSWRS